MVKKNTHTQEIFKLETPFQWRGAVFRPFIGGFIFNFRTSETGLLVRNVDSVENKSSSKIKIMKLREGSCETFLVSLDTLVRFQSLGE